MTMPISGEVSHRKLGFARINMHVKSEVSILSYSKDILEGDILDVTWPRPFQGQFVTRKLGLATMNLHAKFDVSSLSRSRDILGE